MYLFFDTETTGLPRNWKAPVTDLNNWPRLVQLGYLYCDRNGNKLDEGDLIIKPEGFIIPKESSDVHRITTEVALEKGRPIKEVLIDFEKIIKKANFLVAHNMAFDEKIMGAEFLRNGMKNRIEARPKICTMLQTVNFCKIEGPYGFKWPKLSELHIQLFGVDFEEAHNAAVDIEATAQCFFELKKLGIININEPEPIVKSKNPQQLSLF